MSGIYTEITLSLDVIKFSVDNADLVWYAVDTTALMERLYQIWAEGEVLPADHKLFYNIWSVLKLALESDGVD